MAQHVYFSWVGSAVADTVLIAARGDTHGAVLTSFSTTGDTTAGSAILQNLANIAELIDGELYGIAGPGILGGTTFIYLGGFSILLSAAATATQSAETVTITKPVIILTTAANVSAGNNAVTGLASVRGLQSGQTYGVSGFGIPRGATFVYGGGSSINLSQPATNTENGVTLTISGLPQGDATVVDNIASLSGLTAGLTYNISGPGIQGGTGFVAAASNGAITSVTLDTPATLSAVNVPLTISGPRTPDGGAFDTSQHLRDDEDICALQIGHNEGSFPELEIDIRNPEKGLLSPGREIWCWLSWDDGVGTIWPLFHGRLVGVPEQLQQEVVRLKFLAKPNDFAAQKETLAETMRTLPYWDPIWLKDVYDPDTVLEARSALWHIDRASLVVSASDIVTGEDGTLSFGEGDHFYDEMSFTHGQAPLTQVAITGTVSWTQQGDGKIDITRTLVKQFQAAGSPYGYPLISTLTGDGLLSSWPQAGTVIGAGWAVSNDTSPLTPATWMQSYNYKVSYYAQTERDSSASLSTQFLTPWTKETVSFPVGVYSIIGEYGLPSSGAAGTNGFNSGSAYQNVGFFNGGNPFQHLNTGNLTNYYGPGVGFGLFYQASRKRTETVSVTMLADMQTMLTDAAGEERESLDLSSDVVGEAIDPNGSVPIGDLRRNSYFKTDRGTASFEYLLLLGRAKILARARAVEVKFGIPWNLATGLSCRYSATLSDRRLPAGGVTGKVKAYRLIMADGVQRAEVTIGCTIGDGNTITGSAGTNSYADGYADSGQVVSNAQIDLGTDDLWYESFDDFTISDDGLDLFNMTPETVIRNLNSVTPAVNLSTVGDLHDNTIIDNMASVTGLVVGNRYRIIGAGIPLGATCLYSGGLQVTLDQATRRTASSVAIQLTRGASSGIISGGLTAQVNTINGGTNQLGYSDPIANLKNLPTVVTLDLIPVAGSEFATLFTPATSALMVPKTVDLEAA